MAASPAILAPETAPGHHAATPSFDAAAVAAGLFRQRQSYASRMVAEGRLSRDVAEAKLRPWLAIAAAAGADLPELELHGNEIWPDTGKPVVHRLHAEDIGPAGDWRETLASARDAAVNTAENNEKRDDARALVRLAQVLHIRSWKP